MAIMTAAQRASQIWSVLASARVKQRESEKELKNPLQSLMQRAFKGVLIG